MTAIPTIEITRTLAPFTVRLKCAGALRAQGETLLDVIQQMHASGALKDGASLRVAGLDLRLQTATQTASVSTAKAPEIATVLDVCEPNFDAPAPQPWRKDVSATLAWVAAQASLLQRLGVEGREVSLHQSVVLARDALNARHLQALRSQPLDDDDSGWCLTAAESDANPDDPDAYIGASVMEILCARPELGTVLALPPGFAATFEQHQLVSVFDAQGALCWSESPA